MEACDKYADRYKHEKYDDGFRNTQIVFVPVVFSTFGSLNQEGYAFFKDLFRRNCDTLGKERCVHMPLLWQKLSVLLQNENFKMMSRRFKLSHELSKITISNTEITENEMDKEYLIPQSNQNQDLESLLKEALEESNLVFENIGKISSESYQKEDLSEMDEEIVISEYSNLWKISQKSRIF